MIRELTDEEWLEHRDRQIAKVAKAIRITVAVWPGTDPRALTQILEACGTDYGLLGGNDFAAARILAKGVPDVR